ncbi:putative ubiquitinyl hydrolase 1 [Helianthus annuus]|uniref:Ubiquitin carboxyl-terminal hydrolase n=1 Tax=Helianthus annuus TaxID=4232 RepID=A0A9K3HLZ2_HELAN|nr:putative ubiquitinyl hydrolase 1 [Helianthus annuus]KAJ0873866.1 putative ubiquitinyl hydrolase 1 [Helianthus annuus]
MELQLQMNWQTALLLKKRKNAPPLGFRNLGNTCYLNAVLQCLTYTPPLANFCLRRQHSASCDSLPQQDKKNNCPFCLLETRIARSLSVDLLLDTPGKFIGGLKIFAEHFRVGRQEDAHEFLRYVIDACHTTSIRLKKLQQQKRKLVSNGGGDSVSGSTVVKEIFGGALQSQVKCLACGNESNKVDEIMDISIDVVNSSSIKEAFQKFFQPEILDGNNKYKCESCKMLVAARKQMSILQAPNILVIQLKRFEGIYGRKIDKEIAFEEVLVLSSFMCKTSQDPHPEYKLFATIVHSGCSPDSGHYYAYIKDAFGRWYCCNDSYVSVSSLEEVFSEKVYILFFSRNKQKPILPNKTLSTNGTKTHDCNGNDTSKIPKSGQQKSTDSQQPKVDPATSSSKVGKYLYVPQKKPVSFGISGPKKALSAIHNKENNDNNGDAEASNAKKTIDKKIPLLEDKYGFSQNKQVANGNVAIRRNGDEVVTNGCKNSFTRNGTETGQFYNGIGKSPSDESDSRMKHEEQKSTVLLAEDHSSLAKREELTETLVKEASSFLRKCGYSDEVATFMRAKKLSIRDECGNALQRNELKKMIADAKVALIPQIPDSLKTELIKRIRSHIAQ